MIPSGCFCYPVWWARTTSSFCGTFFSSGGNEALIEAAKIDGAGEFRIYAQIVLPISKPALATIGLFTAIGNFSNCWFGVLLYIDNENLWTIQYMCSSAL